MSIDRFRLVHISDLHFVANPFERGSKFRARSWLAKSHSGDKASLLAESLLTLGEVDVLLATGDLTTDGSAEALQTVRAYLRETKLAGTANRRQTYPITALGSVARTTLVVPGNHDRFGGSRMPTQRDSFGFNDIFGEDDLYPHVEYVGDYKRRPVVIFLVNSVPMPDLVEQFTIMRRPMRIAGGKVTNVRMLGNPNTLGRSRSAICCAEASRSRRGFRLMKIRPVVALLPNMLPPALANNASTSGSV